LNQNPQYPILEKDTRRLLELRDKAAKENNKEDWEKYQKMLLTQINQ
jgi:secreted Zn-dependent insulinase-like peptidase